MKNVLLLLLVLLIGGLGLYAYTNDISFKSNKNTYSPLNAPTKTWEKQWEAERLK